MNKGIFVEGKVVGEFTIYEFRIGSPDMEAVEAYATIMGRLVDESTGDKGELNISELIMTTGAKILKQPEVWHILSAGLRKTVEDCKKIKHKKLVKLIAPILELNYDFFAEAPQIVGAIYPTKQTTSPQTAESSITKPTS